MLSFPLDMRDPLPDGLPRQLGDVVVCPARSPRPTGRRSRILLVHGALHLVGYDHEADDGDMLAAKEPSSRRSAPVAARPA